MKARLIGGPIQGYTTTEATDYVVDAIVIQPHRGQYVRTERLDAEGNRIYEWAGYNEI